MPFRSIVAEPDELARLAGAFDAAWIEINRVRPVEATSQSAARERLGYIITTLWKAGEGELAAKAVERFGQDDLAERSAPAPEPRHSESED